MPFADKSTTADRPTARLWIAGTDETNPILAGLSAVGTIKLNDDEAVKSVVVTDDDSYTKTLTFSTSGGVATTQTIVFGTDTQSSAAGTRQWLVWTTNQGVVKEQFWVRDVPTAGAIYINNIDAQSSIPLLYVNWNAPATFWEYRATLSIAILPNWAGEHFSLGEAATNRYAQTLRSWGGAKTVEVIFDDTTTIIAETAIENVDGYFFPILHYGLHTLKFRLRAETGSSDYVDITVSIRARQIPDGGL